MRMEKDQFIRDLTNKVIGSRNPDDNRDVDQKLLSTKLEVVLIFFELAIKSGSMKNTADTINAMTILFYTNQTVPLNLLQVRNSIALVADVMGIQEPEDRRECQMLIVKETANYVFNN